MLSLYLVVIACSSLVALADDDAISFGSLPKDKDVQLKAPSTFQNCDCQCDSYQIANRKGQAFGNCRRYDEVATCELKKLGTQP